MHLFLFLDNFLNIFKCHLIICLHVQIYFLILLNYNNRQPKAFCLFSSLFLSKIYQLVRTLLFLKEVIFKYLLHWKYFLSTSKLFDTLTIRQLFLKLKVIFPPKIQHLPLFLLRILFLTLFILLVSDHLRLGRYLLLIQL